MEMDSGTLIPLIVRMLAGAAGVGAGGAALWFFVEFAREPTVIGALAGLASAALSVYLLTIAVRLLRHAARPRTSRTLVAPWVYGVFAAIFGVLGVLLIWIGYSHPDVSSLTGIGGVFCIVLAVFSLGLSRN
jgi:hypothetical protein